MKRSLNLNRTVQVLLVLGALLLTSTNVFANHNDFRASLSNSERIALTQEENQALRPHEILRLEDSATVVNKDHEVCDVGSLRDNLSVPEHIALIKSEYRNLSSVQLAHIEESLQKSVAAVNDDNCGAGSFRNSLNPTELKALQREESQG